MQRTTEPSIAHLVTDWTNRMSAIARNLIDFNESENAQRMKARLSSPSRPYQGRTAAAARAATEALEGLWRDYLLVSRVVDEAAVLAKKSGLLSNTDDAVRALLESASIELPSISVPVHRRGLLDGAERIARARPDDVLDSMLNAFAKARDGVTAIAEAETSVTRRLQALEAETAALRDWADACGEDLGLVDLAPDEADRDPLAALDRVARAEQALAPALTKRREIETRIADLRRGLDRAEQNLAALRAMHARLVAALSEAAKAFGGVTTPEPGDETSAHAIWLTAIRETAGTRWKAAAIGLARLDATCKTQLDAATKAHAAVRAPLDAMDNIKGRFRALRVKGERQSAGGSDETLRSLEAKALEILQHFPFSIDEARRAVDGYEAALAGRRAMPLNGSDAS